MPPSPTGKRLLSHFWSELKFHFHKREQSCFFSSYFTANSVNASNKLEEKHKTKNIICSFHSRFLNNIRRNIYKGNIEIKTENSNKYYSIIFFLPIAILSGLTLVVLCVCVCALFFVMFFFLSNFRRVFHLHENKFIDLAIFYVYK